MWINIYYHSWIFAVQFPSFRPSVTFGVLCVVKINSPSPFVASQSYVFAVYDHNMIATIIW